MKILSPYVHGIIDYVVIVFLFLSPTIFGLTGLPATIAYALAVIHLILTVCTAFSLGLIKVIPFYIHGYIEVAVSVILLILPWVAGFSKDAVARNFYLGFGIAVFLTWLITDYKSVNLNKRLV